MTDRSSHNSRIDILVDEYLARKRRGEHPTINRALIHAVQAGPHQISPRRTTMNLPHLARPFLLNRTFV